MVSISVSGGDTTNYPIGRTPGELDRADLALLLLHAVLAIAGTPVSVDTRQDAGVPTIVVTVGAGSALITASDYDTRHSPIQQLIGLVQKL